MNIRLLMTLLIIAILALVIWHDTHSFKVRRYEVRTNKLKKDLTFVLLADLHGYVYGRNNEKLIAAIDEIHPDGILCAGDMFTARKIKGKVHIEAGMELLEELASRYPVYMSGGNHEEKIKRYTKDFGNLFERYKGGLVRSGVTYLENESADFNLEDSFGRIRIFGLELELGYFRKVAKRKLDPGHIVDKLGRLKGQDEDAFNILIAHNPQYFKEYAEWGADLIVSGHVHGGIIRLPLLGGVISPAIVLFPKYDGGKYEKDGRTMILSRGLGTHTIHVRMFNPAEVSAISIKGV